LLESSPKWKAARSNLFTSSNFFPPADARIFWTWGTFTPPLSHAFLPAEEGPVALFSRLGYCLTESNPQEEPDQET
jgi:hypothetical protein